MIILLVGVSRLAELLSLVHTGLLLLYIVLPATCLCTPTRTNTYTQTHTSTQAACDSPYD